MCSLILHILEIPLFRVCLGSLMAPSASDVGAAPCPCLDIDITLYSCPMCYISYLLKSSGIKYSIPTKLDIEFKIVYSFLTKSISNGGRSPEAMIGLEISPHLEKGPIIGPSQLTPMGRPTAWLISIGP